MVSKPERECPICGCPIVGEIQLDDHELWPDRPWIANHEGGRFCALTEAQREATR